MNLRICKKWLFDTAVKLSSCRCVEHFPTRPLAKSAEEKVKKNAGDFEMFQEAGLKV
jgi:hypothetical protein